MIRLKIGFVVVAIAFIVIGGQMAHDGMSNGSKPLEVTIDDLHKKRPDQTWIKIKDGMLMVPFASFMEDTRTHQIHELFIPVITSDENAPDHKEVKVLLRTKDPELLMRARELRKLDKAPDAVSDDYFDKNEKKLFIAKEVQGLIEWGINSETSTRDQIAKLSVGKFLASDWLILRDGEEPQGGSGFALCALGVVMLLGGGAWALGVFDKKRPPARKRAAMEDPDDVRPREEPRVIDVGEDFAKELGLEKAQDAPAKPTTKKIVARPATKKVAAPEGAAPKVAPKITTKKIAAAPKPAPEGAEAAEAAEKPAKPKPLIPRKKRILPS